MVRPLRKRRVSVSSHCRSFLVAPSLVSCLGSLPSTFINQISLFATNAILSTPPRLGSSGAVGVSVAVGTAWVGVSSDTSTGSVTLVCGIDVSVKAGADVDGLMTGASVSMGVLLIPLNKKKPPAMTAMATPGRITTIGLKAFFGTASSFLLTTVLFMAGNAWVCNLVE